MAAGSATTGLPNTVALDKLHSGIPNEGKLRLRFNSLRDHLYAKLASHDQDSGEDGLSGTASGYAANKFHVDLEDIRLIRGQQVQGRVTRSKVVNRGDEAMLLALIEHVVTCGERR